MRGNIGNILKQAQAVQENLKKAQEQVAQITATGESGGGMVKVTLNGKHEAVRVEIGKELLGEDKEMLEDLIAAAINDATHKVGVAVNEKMAGAMAGLSLPPGMKLPF
jgi:DNA-binding YbaB/EbfC family protein